MQQYSVTIWVFNDRSQPAPLTRTITAVSPKAAESIARQTITAEGYQPDNTTAYVLPLHRYIDRTYRQAGIKGLFDL